ncbi:MAG: NAD-dependent epimerase/dehydratase family protein [Arenicella sp.]|nr:NAD-dependent epimerase/dehydratase family protein [Arenicella sp.]
MIGTPLCDKLAQSGQAYRAISRSPADQKTLVWDMSQPPARDMVGRLSGVDTIFHCAPIWLLPAHLSLFKDAGMTRLIAISSTSVISKIKSASPAERSLATQLAKAEDSLRHYCDGHGVALTIFRPSMVYGRTLDQNIMQIARSIRRFGLVVVAGAASGKRQPVHCDDLVSALLLAQHNNHTYGKTYELAGAEVISYRSMIERIFVALGKKPRIMQLPMKIVRAGLRTAALFSKFGYTPEMANRMNQDLVYDYSQANRDFAYTAREFSLDPEIDLGVEP